jgi:hypothetical protein
VSWLWSPTQPARMHRRLRGAVVEIHLSPARRATPARCSVDELRRELEYQAVELDHHLVVAARHPRRRRRELLGTLDHHVAEVEALSVRLSRMSRPAGAVTSGWDLATQPPEVLARLGQQLDLLEQASEELAEIERSAGLVDVDAVLAPLEQKARPSSAQPPTPLPPPVGRPPTRVTDPSPGA